MCNYLNKEVPRFFLNISTHGRDYARKCLTNIRSETSDASNGVFKRSTNIVEHTHTQLLIKIFFSIARQFSVSINFTYSFGYNELARSYICAIRSVAVIKLPIHGALYDRCKSSAAKGLKLKSCYLLHSISSIEII